MFSGELVDGKEFFELLFSDQEFCSELGRAMLGAGQLEASLLSIFEKHQILEAGLDTAPLGGLIRHAKKHELFDKPTFDALDDLKQKRDYFAHNIYALLYDYKEETILFKSGLIDSDVWAYRRYIVQLRENLFGVADSLLREAGRA